MTQGPSLVRAGVVVAAGALAWLALQTPPASFIATPLYRQPDSVPVRAPTVGTSAAAASARPVSAPSPAPESVAIVDSSHAAPAVIPTRVQAADWMRERMDAWECASTRRATEPQHLARLDAGDWRWLPAAQVAAERAAWQAAVDWRLARCPPPPTSADDQGAKAFRANLEAAARTGDLQARLQMLRYTPVGRHDRAAIAELFREILRSGDTELIAALSLHEIYLSDGELLQLVLQAPSAWELIACDLGRDCGDGSVALNRLCLLQPATCVSGSIEDALRRVTPPAQFARVQQRRAELLARIRSGQIAGMFDPTPAAARPDGG